MLTMEETFPAKLHLWNKPQSEGSSGIIIFSSVKKNKQEKVVQITKYSNTNPPGWVRGLTGPCCLTWDLIWKLKEEWKNLDL